MAKIQLAWVLALFNLFVVGIGAFPINYKHNGVTLTTEQITEYLVKYGYLPDKSDKSSKNNGTAIDTAKNDTSGNETAVADNAVATFGGELPPSTDSQYAPGEIPRAIGYFQEVMSLKKTMILDADTMKAMVQPRCGVKDKTPHTAWITGNLRRRRYVPEGSRWYQRIITYSLSEPSPQMSIVDQKDVLQVAFNRWAEVCPLIFRFTDNLQGADLNVRFARRWHNDGTPFDGPGNTLAHAFYPAYGGDVHFDEDEAWSAGIYSTPANKKSVLAVAVHEIGHSLGLRHSSAKGSVMGPLYQGSATIELGDDDVRGIQSLYGRCTTDVDAAFSWLGDRRTYFIKAKNLWRFDDIKSESERRYPQLLEDLFTGVPSTVDEAFLWGGNWKTYFFKGSQYYRYNDLYGQVEYGYPKPISSAWHGVPNDIDAAFSINASVSYFFKGDQCYMFDSRNSRVFAGYPKTINDCFPGVPSNLDTAVRYYWDNVVYFFKKQYFYIWNRQANKAAGPYLISSKWRNLCTV